jgi:hypothetical protein
MTRASWPTLAHAFRRAALPLSWYYIVTLVLPLANGAAQSGGVFASHAVVVLVVPPIVITCACAIHKIAHVFTSAGDRPRLSPRSLRAFDRIGP